MSKINLGTQGQVHTLPSDALATSEINVTNGVVVLDSQARLPAVDGSLLLNVPGTGGPFTLSAGSPISVDTSVAGISQVLTITATGQAAFMDQAAGSSSSSGLWEVVSSVRVDTPVDEINFSALDLDADGFYRIYVFVQNTSGSYSLWYNNDLTSDNYEHAGMDSFVSNNTGTMLAAGIGGGKFEVIDGYRPLSGALISFPAAYNAFTEIEITVGRATDSGEVTATAQTRGFRDSQWFSSRWTVTGSNVTDLKLTGDVSPGFPAGSTIVLYRLGSGGTTPDPAVQLTFTGTPRSPMYLEYAKSSVVPAAASTGIHTYRPTGNPSLTDLSIVDLGITSLSLDNVYAVGDTVLDLRAATDIALPALIHAKTLKIIGSSSLTSLDLSTLETVCGPNTNTPSFDFEGSGLTTIDIPGLTQVGDGMKLANHSLATTVSAGALINITGLLTLENMPALTSIDLPVLESIGQFHPLNLPLVTSIDLASLTTVRSYFDPTGLNALASLSCPELTTIGAGFGPVDMEALTSIDFPSLTSVGSISAVAWPSMITFDLPALLTVTGDVTVNSMNALTTLSMNALVSVGGTFSPSSLPSLTTMSMHNLATVGGIFTPFTALGSLTSVDFSSLATVGGSFNALGNEDSLLALAFPSLASVGTSFHVASLTALSSIDLGSLASIGQFMEWADMTSLGSIDMPSLATVGQHILVHDMASIHTLNLPALVSVGGYVSATTGLAAFMNVTLGTVGITKSIAGDIDIGGQMLTQASIDGILAVVASLDGTAGTTSWGTGRTLTLDGGTSFAPSVAGLGYKATIEGRGGTVLVNS